MKKLIIILIILISITPIPLHANKSTVITYSPSRFLGFSRTQDAYLPRFNISHLGLNSPENMASCSNDLLFIADTGNSRIVVFDTITTNLVREIYFPGFQSPRGVFVTDNNILYVADAGAGAVFLFTTEGEHIRTFYEPADMPLMEIPFSPVRIAVDGRGNMYIVGEGVFNGIIHISPEGEFLGFFASNETQLTLAQRLQNIFFTQRQLEGVGPRNPLTFSNVTVDSRGVVYTTTTGPSAAVQGNSLQRHDMSGRNTIHEFIDNNTKLDVAVNENGIIFTASSTGTINIYTNSGELIFFLAQGTGGGGHEDIAGWFRFLTSVAVTSNGDIWALDSTNAILQSFTPTEYALSIFHAINLFNRGMYEESGGLWREALRRNQMSVLAHNGLGRSHLYRMEFGPAMEHFYLAGNQAYYSISFWEVRNDWLLSNVGVVLIIIIAVLFIRYAIKLIDRQKVVHGKISSTRKFFMENKFTAPILFSFSVARHPINNFYLMKVRQKGNYPGAVLHFVLLFSAYMLYQTSRGFVVQFVSIENIDFVAVIGMFLGGIILFIISNYLVTSITGGEGSLGDIFKLISYSSLPMTVTLVANTVLSHVVTDNEVFLLSFIFWGGLLYFVSITWIGLMELHSYSFTANLRSLIMTVFFMLVAIVVLYVITILVGEILSFIDSIGWEVAAIVREN